MWTLIVALVAFVAGVVFSENVRKWLDTERGLL